MDSTTHAKPGVDPGDKSKFTLARALPEDMRGVYAELPRGFTM